ncbi:helix-turn-helix domain-containing protein [Paenibacillus sp.]|uniref:helix-turn-helix domain-containing protein n=1 Tax=Paenibacillus sp. TaxID=58172 RepID=UPI002811A328|nr:helix-turn-helix domain-containing protein [Paenibacillus sp.]
MKLKAAVPIFYKYVASFVAVLLVPILFLGISGYEQTVNLIHDEVTVSHQNRVLQWQEQIDAKLIQMNKIAAEVAANPELTPYSLERSFYQAYRAKALLNYKMANEFVHEMLLYIRGGDYLYSSVSTYKTQRFINEIYRYRDWDEAQFRQAIESSSRPAFRPAEEVRLRNDRSRLVTYLVPIPYKSNNPYGTLLFLIPEDALLPPERIDRSGNTVVLDQNGNVVASLKPAGGLPDAAELLPDAAGPSFHIRSVDGTDHYISHIRSKLTGWTYVTMLPVAEVMKPVHEMRDRWLLNLMLIVLIGGLIIYGLVYVNYHPIRELVRWADARWGLSDRKADELDTVRSLIDRMGQSNQELGQKLQNNRSAIQEHLLLQVLRGEVSDVSAFNDRGREYGVSFSHPRFLVVMFDLAAERAAAHKATLRSLVAGSASAWIEAYGKDDLDDRRIPFLVSTSLDDGELAGWVEELHRSLRDERGIATTVGVGNAYPDIGRIGKSYLEASTAADFKLIRGNGKIIHFQDVSDGESGAVSYPTQELSRLETLIRQGDAERIADVLGGIAAAIRDRSATLFAARCLCFDIVNTVLKTVAEMNALPGATERLPNVLSLMRFDTVEELTERVMAACIDLCRLIERGKAEAPLIASMLAYIEERFADPEFSVRQLAERFSLSESYVSRYVKEQTGKNVSEHVHRLRVERAKQLLARDDRPLKDIVEQVGYYDASSFIRTFKRSVGVTPGEFRRLYKPAE